MLVISLAAKVSKSKLLPCPSCLILFLAHECVSVQHQYPCARAYNHPIPPSVCVRDENEKSVSLQAEAQPDQTTMLCVCVNFAKSNPFQSNPVQLLCFYHTIQSIRVQESDD